MSNEKALNSILKSLKAINARLGTVATASLSADVAAATADLATEITAEEAVNTVIDTAASDEAISNALLDTLVTDEGAVNTVCDLAQVSVGSPIGTDTIGEQIVALKVKVQANHG
jgi:hypothetical protein